MDQPLSKHSCLFASWKAGLSFDEFVDQAGLAGGLRQTTFLVLFKVMFCVFGLLGTIFF